MVYDISQEVLSCNVFPGDPHPEIKRVNSIDRGDICNLTSLTMCAHNGTHVDAPFHFLNEGKTLEQMPPVSLQRPKSSLSETRARQSDRKMRRWKYI